MFSGWEDVLQGTMCCSHDTRVQDGGLHALKEPNSPLRVKPKSKMPTSGRCQCSHTKYPAHALPPETCRGSNPESKDHVQDAGKAVMGSSFLHSNTHPRSADTRQ